MRRMCTLCILVIVAVAQVSVGDVPQTMSYQGVLKNADGSVVADGEYGLTFRIYDSEAAETELWLETQTVTVTGGIFGVILGGTTPLTMAFDAQYWLGVQVESDPELTPRVRLTAAPYALRAKTAEVADDDWEISGNDIYRLPGFVGIGTETPTTELDVAGTAKVEGLELPTGAAAGHVLTSDATGVGTWQAPAAVSDGDWTISGNDIYRPSGFVGIVTTTPSARLDVVGTAEITGDCTLNGRLEVDSSHSRVVDAEYTGGPVSNATAVYGYSKPADGAGYGGQFEGGYTGVYALASGEGEQSYMGVHGQARSNSSSSTARGVHGWAAGSVGTKYGVYGYASSGGTAYAGWFDGALYAESASAGIKTFRIDHPLDPANRYLNHSSVESADMMNIYNGNIVLDAGGKAWIQLPDWFEILNRDFRYQLTCIGGFAPVYVAQKIEDGTFLIAGGEADMEVSWQVTGIRHDPLAEARRIEVEEDKPSWERGKYLTPEVYGLPRTMALGYVEREELE